MPIYEYRCRVCNDIFEYKKRIKNTFHCGEELVRIFSPAGVHLKGSGFYKTDYERKS